MDGPTLVSFSMAVHRISTTDAERRPTERCLDLTGRPLLDTKQLYTFCVLARTSSFTRTAAELGCCQSTVTVHIKALERELGSDLVERSWFSKRVALTDAGRPALGYAQRFLDLLDEARAVVSGDGNARSSILRA